MATYLTSTRDRRLAAALGSLGIRIQLRATYLEKAGVRVTRFLLDLVSQDKRYATKPLQKGWKDGTLQAKQPAHPLLTMMRAFENRDRILDLAKQGKPCHLVRVPGTRDHQYLPGGTGLPGVAKGAAIIETADLKMVAALATAGLPVLRILPGTRGHMFHLAAHVIIDGIPVDGIALLRAWRADKESCPPGLNFTLAAWALHNRERLLDAERKEIALILIRKPRTTKSALIRADATDAAYDRAKEFFDQ